MSAGPAGPVSSSTSSPTKLPRRIVLTGFMGAGKSTVGRLLAARLHWPFLDIDSLITAEHGLTVAQIFAQDGEEHFRRIEAEAIARVLDPAHEYDHAVIALGGGAIETTPDFQRWFIDEIRAGMPPQREEQADIPIYIMPNGDTAGARGAAIQALQFARQNGLM